jgi:ribosomal protein S18 acetylase RimI-like enzyme
MRTGSGRGARMTETGVTVEQAAVADHELLDAIKTLLPQLSSAAPPTFAELDEVATSPATTLFVARNAGGRIVGALTLAHFRLPTGVRAWIEDVVVDQTERGGGIGSALVEAAVDVARQAGARTVDLTSRPDREAANRLYQRLGFVRRETNVYRYAIDGG